MKKKSLLLTAVATLGLTAATMAQNVPNYVPTNGLVGWWPFNGNANDESGNGNNGTVNGPIPDYDRFGNLNKSYFFNGISNKIVIQNTLLANTFSSHTTAVWIKTSSQTDQTIYQDRGSNEGYPNFFWYKNASSIQSQFNGGWNHGSHNNNCVNSLNTQQPVWDGIWHHLVSVLDATNFTIKLYQDGNLIATLPNIDSNCYGNFSQPTSIGCTMGGGYPDAQFFLGQIDDIGIWNRTLTQQEITALYTAINCANNTTITPQNNSLTTGSTAIFTATTSDPNPSYVWQSDLGQGYVALNNYGNYSGANTANLNIANVQLSEHNQPIRVITTSGNCIDTSNVAVISILDTCITNVTIYDTLLTTVTDTLVINATITGINPPNNSNTIKVFPNPTNDHITIDYGNFSLMNGYQLQIENSIGQQVFQTSITQQSDYLSLTTWGGNGLYFVHIIDPQGNTIDIRKIVLQ